MTFKVLITRDKRRVQDLIDQLALNQVIAVAIPLTEIVPILDSNSIPDLNSYSLIVFTSVNAVEVFAGVLEDDDILLAKSMKFAAVGSKTASAIKSKFANHSIIAGDQDGGKLVKAIVNSSEVNESDNILWLCAEKTAGDFLSLAQKSGLQVDRHPIYRSDQRSISAIRNELIASQPFDLMFFAAPSQVKAFAEAMHGGKSSTCVGIGATTSAELLRQGFTQVTTSKSPSVVDVTEAILEALG